MNLASNPHINFSWHSLDKGFKAFDKITLHINGTVAVTISKFQVRTKHHIQKALSVMDQDTADRFGIRRAEIGAVPQRKPNRRIANRVKKFSQYPLLNRRHPA